MYMATKLPAAAALVSSSRGGRQFSAAHFGKHIFSHKSRVLGTNRIECTFDANQAIHTVAFAFPETTIATAKAAAAAVGRGGCVWDVCVTRLGRRGDLGNLCYAVISLRYITWWRRMSAGGGGRGCGCGFISCHSSPSGWMMDWIGVATELIRHYLMVAGSYRYCRRRMAPFVCARAGQQPHSLAIFFSFLFVGYLHRIRYSTERYRLSWDLKVACGSGMGTPPTPWVDYLGGLVRSTDALMRSLPVGSHLT